MKNQFDTNSVTYYRDPSPHKRSISADKVTIDPSGMIISSSGRYHDPKTTRVVRPSEMPPTAGMR